MPLTITRTQRDAIYEMVINHLSAIDDVWKCVNARKYGEAKRLGREFAEDLRLLEDLGWADTTDRETVALTLPSDELTRVLARLHKDTAASLRDYVSRPKLDEDLAQRDVAASQALGDVLSRLAQPANAERVTR
ncbi:MAG TPA: hypothetical protein VF257_15720 [Solirubrobacteraceae bacterium]